MTSEQHAAADRYVERIEEMLHHRYGDPERRMMRDAWLAGHRTTCEADVLIAAVLAFVEHHDNGQAGQPGHPKTYGQQDVWLAKWDRRYEVLKALVGAESQAHATDG